MKANNTVSFKILTQKLLVPCFILTIGLSMRAQEVTLHSNSFNAKQRSTFVIAGVSEAIDRGLTIVHFNSPEHFEYRTFDTYGSPEDLRAFLETLEKMKVNGAPFAVLAHDSATKGSLDPNQELVQMGLSKLSKLKGRQAYVMYDVGAGIVEEVNDIEVMVTLKIPGGLSDAEIYFPKVRYDFEPSNDRYIAHAAGEVNDVKSTNSREALDENYKKGFRLFELDIITTSDGKLVAAHDWKMWARFTDFKGTLPPSHAEFMKRKIYGDYTTLDMQGINTWFAAHPDAILITDKLNDPMAFANGFIDKERLLMELFSEMSIEEASQNGIKPMISQEVLLGLVGDKLNFLEVNNVKHAAVSRRIIARETDLMLRLKEKGVKVYVYNVNFDPGKDEKYVQENEIGLIYGMYADKWIFDEYDGGPAK